MPARVHRCLPHVLAAVPAGLTALMAPSSPPATAAPGSAGHEVQDARRFAARGVDYLKYDWRSGSGTRDEQVARFGNSYPMGVGTTAAQVGLTGAAFTRTDPWTGAVTSTSGGTANGTSLILWNCNGQANQRWAWS